MWTRQMPCFKVRTIEEIGIFRVQDERGNDTPLSSFLLTTITFQSIVPLFIGLYPPFNESLQLANGSTVTWPSRAQLIQIETIEPDQEVWLEGWSDCDSCQDRLNKWYESEEFKSQASIANPFYESLSNVLGNRPKTLENA